MVSRYGVLGPTSSWDLLASLGHPSTFQRVSRLGSVTARHSSSGRQPNFAALNRGRHLYSAGWPSRWALAHILVLRYVTEFGCFRGALCKSGWRCRRKKFTFAILSPDQFIVLQWLWANFHITEYTHISFSSPLLQLCGFQRIRLCLKTRLFLLYQSINQSIC